MTVLRALNNGLLLFGSDYEFAIELIKQPLPDRFDWLMEIVNHSILKDESISLQDASDLREFVNYLEGGYDG